MELQLPEDLNADMDVLFVKPYSPEDTRHLEISGCGPVELTRIFEKTIAADPGFEQFNDIVNTARQLKGLKGYALGRDLIILYGDEKVLFDVRDLLRDRYTCFIGRMGDFLDYIAQDENVTIIKDRPPTIH